jgi:hypothetical protein
MAPPNPIHRPISPSALAHHGGVEEEADEARQNDGQHSRSLDCFGVDQ